MKTTSWVLVKCHCQNFISWWLCYFFFQDASGYSFSKIASAFKNYVFILKMLYTKNNSFLFSVQAPGFQNSLPYGSSCLFEIVILAVPWDQFSFYPNQRWTCGSMGYTLLHHAFVERSSSIHHDCSCWHWLDIHQAYFSWQRQETIYDCDSTTGKIIFLIRETGIRS